MFSQRKEEEPVPKTKQMDKALHEITNSLLASPTTTFLPNGETRSEKRTSKLAELKAERRAFLDKVRSRRSSKNITQEVKIYVSSNVRAQPPTSGEALYLKPRLLALYLKP